jgi:uncharacterized protein YuzE
MVRLMVMPMPRLKYDPQANALYIYLRDFDHVARTETRLEWSRNIDYDDAGNAVGIEFWNADLGLHLDDVPERATVERLLAGQRFKLYG